IRLLNLSAGPLLIGEENHAGCLDGFRSQCIRPSTPLTIDDTKRAVGSFVEHYNTERLHSAIGCVTPLDMLEGRQNAIHDERDRKLEEARRGATDASGTQKEGKICDAPKSFATIAWS
ncbi:MAG: integrase core domain-containing protein, partial [Planctomycetaceae bacterium]